MSIKAAKIVGINYSTAKTILFFNRNGDKSYQFEFKKLQKAKEISCKATASFVDINLFRNGIPNKLNSASPVEIISTVGCRHQIIQ